MREGPLDMRMDTTQGMTAAEWLAGVSERELAGVLRITGRNVMRGVLPGQSLKSDRSTRSFLRADWSRSSRTPSLPEKG